MEDNYGRPPLIVVLSEFELRVDHLQKEHGLRFRKDGERLLCAQPAVKLIVFQSDDHVEARSHFVRAHISIERLGIECNLLARDIQDRKSTRLNSSHLVISYA